MGKAAMAAAGMLARRAVHFDDSEDGDYMRELAVRVRREHDAERAVIEAARAWVNVGKEPWKTDHHMANASVERQIALCNAVEALEEKP